MEVNVFSKPVNGKACLTVTFSEEIDGLFHSADVIVFVEPCDSRTELAARAKTAARSFLSRCLEEDLSESP
jgi:hypothetical protein